jgi:hypothetical protein
MGTIGNRPSFADAPTRKSCLSQYKNVTFAKNPDAALRCIIPLAFDGASLAVKRKIGALSLIFHGKIFGLSRIANFRKGC